MPGNRVYLASRSLRRRELLKQIGVSFEVLLVREEPRRRVDVDETPQPDETPADYVLRIARAKAAVAAGRVRERRLQLYPVLAADTSVVLDGTIIGKPQDAEHAAQILSALAGREHQVISAVAVAMRDRVESRLSASTVELRLLSAAEIRRYVAGGEPFDKAGAYGIQGRAAAFVTRINGSYSGIMGLPLAETAELLRSFDIEVL